LADITSLLPALNNTGTGNGLYGGTDVAGTPADALFKAEAVGRWQLLDTVSLTGASVDTASIGTSANVMLKLVIVDAKFNTDNISLLMRFNAGGVQSTNYKWGNFRWTDSGSTGQQASSGDTSIQLADSIGDDTNESLSGEIIIYSPFGSTWKRSSGMLNYTTFNPSQFGLTHSGIWQGTTAMSAIRLFPSSGNFSSGTVYVLGLAI
jgi:hypothetical protein